METMTDTPRIYVASLSDYNAGTLHGVWIDIDETTTADEIQEQVNAMLAESPEARRFPMGGPAEEWAIHDTEGFGRLLGEWESFERVAEIGAAIAEHGAAVIAYLDNDPSADLGDFEDAYQGEWASVADYAEQLAEDIDAVAIAKTNVWPFTCIDWERAGRELVMGGDIWTADGARDYGVFVFRNM